MPESSLTFVELAHDLEGRRIAVRSAAGSNPGAFSAEGRSLDGKTWDMFSWHHEEGWRPLPRVEDGSSILDWWRSIQKRLAEAN